MGNIFGGQTSNTKVTTNSNRCPNKFTLQTISGGWFSGDSYNCLPPTSNFDSRAVPTGQVVGTVGVCTTSTSDTNTPAAVVCPSGYSDIGTYKVECCETPGDIGCEKKTGWRQQRTCKEGVGSKIFALFYPDTGCYDINQGMGSSFGESQWCNGSPGRTGSGYCWLPYHMTVEGYCFAQDRINTGQWKDGSRSTGGNEVLLNGNVWTSNSFDPPPPLRPITNRGAVTVAVGGGGISGAAVIGIVLFNRKRKMKYAPNSSGSEMPPYSSTV